MRLFLASKAEVNAKDSQGETPLHYAARNTNKDVAQLLIDYDADINRVSERRKETPLVFESSPVRQQRCDTTSH